MVSGRLARSRKSGPGGPEVVTKKFDEEVNKENVWFQAGWPDLGNLDMGAHSA